MVHGLVGPTIERTENSLLACCSKAGARLVSVEVRPFWDRSTSALLSLSLVVAYRHTLRATLRASLSGTFLQKDVVNQCLEFDAEHRFPAPSSHTLPGGKMSSRKPLLGICGHRQCLLWLGAPPPPPPTPRNIQMAYGLHSCL